MRKNILIAIGASLIAISQVLFNIIFLPLLLLEINYQFQNHNLYQNLQAPDYALNQEFKIVIPKIDINSKVFPNVDPFNKQEYQEVLSQGVAQAKDSALPGEKGNIFLFAHSTNSPFISQYNAIFYLAYKLSSGDEIFLFYQGRSYKYIVKKTQIVNSTELNYLKSQNPGQTLTLMTCWPPGTTLKRLLVISQLSKE